MISSDFRDCCIFKIIPLDIVCVATYIPPTNSKYSTPEYMDNLKLFLMNFKDVPTCVLGDMNARFGQPPESDEIAYQQNPDDKVNTNGRTLLDMLEDVESFHIVNGLKYHDLKCDSAHTYFRGKLCSQNDVCLINDLTSVKSFSILQKNTFSDHSPLAIELSRKPTISLALIAQCARYTLKDDHNDINKKVTKPVKLKNIDIVNTISELKTLAEGIKQLMSHQQFNPNELCNIITDGIYQTCKNNRKKVENETSQISFNSNCTSKNYKAIAEANHERYQQLMLEGKSEEEYREYIQIWCEAQKMARKHEEEEFNTRTNERWNSCKKDGRTLWSLIDWKGKSVKYEIEEIPPETIQKYFTGIFQSPKIVDTPPIHDAFKIFTDYETYVHILDKEITLEEVNTAIKDIGTGTSLDGISPDLATIFPKELRETIVDLLNMVFRSYYPEQWQEQLLFPHPKKGHKPADPKLRGIAIGPLLSRLYDIIITARFLKWYFPNKEQAGFRELQGCLLQIFLIFLLMELAKATHNELFIAFMDYEKAFDFMNRAKLIQKMTAQNIGKRFAEAIAQMYSYTAYVPKESNTTLGEKIETKHGVTQGKTSSANFFSFYVSDMPECLRSQINDFMDPFNLAQLADDTATFASMLESLKNKIVELLKYSKDNDQSANIDKTKYLHLSGQPITEPIVIDEERSVESAHKDGYNYIGMLFIASNDIKDQILKNLSTKVINVHKFYAWLEHNRDTPIGVKLLVLYSCALAAMLYGVETWWKIDAYREKVLLIERKALKKCLGVKASVPNNILYIELNRADIVANICDRQYNFYQKIVKFNENEALVKNVVNLCSELDIIKHYEQLSNKNRDNDLQTKKAEVTNSTESMKQRYHSLTGNEYCPSIYESFMREDYRILITRWRLSCFDLKIETDRYRGIPRDERLCPICNVLEDEEHVIFNCRAYENIRTQFSDLLEEHTTTRDILNPQNKETAERVGLMLKLIEDRRNDIF